MRARLVRASGEILLWWVLTSAVWLATLSSLTSGELAVAAACTLPCAVVARLARRANGGCWRFRMGWLSWVPMVVRDVLVQTVQAWLYTLIPARRHAVITVVPLPAEDDRVAAGRRAAATLSFATTPGTVVCDSDSSTGRVLLHRLGQEQGRLESAVQR
ncbi:MAG TPA: Na+/H+ antiporter subunit E [Mycobacterium sp.]|nr:Na+/H+ antiporter subunit E [Mycobacterium sp.]